MHVQVSKWALREQLVQRLWGREKDKEKVDEAEESE